MNTLPTNKSINMLLLPAVLAAFGWSSSLLGGEPSVPKQFDKQQGGENKDHGHDDPSKDAWQGGISSRSSRQGFSTRDCQFQRATRHDRSTLGSDVGKACAARTRGIYLCGLDIHG